jgi:uncharacterized protein YfaS (alpha-2-macroglobulin family)
MKNRKILTAVILLVLIVAGGSLYRYLTRPAPNALTIQGTSPSATAYDEELAEQPRPDPVHIYFSGSAAKLEDTGKPVTKGIAMSPAIKGTWQWDNDSTLTFTPAEDWGVGDKYTVLFDRSLFPNHVVLRDYRYTFRSAPFTAALQKNELYQDPTDPKIKKFVATIKFSHPVDGQDLEKRVSLKLTDRLDGAVGAGAKEYDFTVSYDKFKVKAYIISETVPIPEKDSFMVISVAADLRSSRGGPAFPTKIEDRVKVPSIYNYFRIDNANLTIVKNEREEPEQVLVIEATDGVLESTIREHLSAYILPDDLPELPGKRNAVRNYYWNDTSMVGPEVLNLSRPVELTGLPSQGDYPSLHSFRYTSKVGKFIYIRIDKGIESAGGYLLPGTYDRILRVPEFPKELKIMHDGAILSMSGEKKLSLVARGVDNVKFEISRVLPGQINHLVSQTGGYFSNPYFNNYNFSQDNVTELMTEERALKDIGPSKSQYFSIDFSNYLKTGDGAKRGLFFLKVMSWDPKRKRPTGIEDKRFILITDLGVIVKDNSDGTHDVFVQSMHAGNPEAGASVEVIGKNGLTVVKKTADSDGHAAFPSLKDFDREKTPTAYIVHKGGDLAFIPYDRSDREINFSRFDTGGLYTAGQTDKLDAYLFSDRGIYRPGEEFQVGMIVKHPDWGKNITGIPLELVVTDPRGIVLKVNKIKVSETGFEEISYRTEDTSPTGNYQVSAYIVKDGRRAGFLGSTSVKVEEFLPDRLKISTRFSSERKDGWVHPDGLKGVVTLKNLFGTPAASRRVAAGITLSPAYPAFRAYRDYRFYDPLKAEKSFGESLKDQKTDDQGTAEFAFRLERFDRATYRLTFTAEGYEAEGGRGVVSENSVLVSPLEYLVGYKADGDLGYINKGSKRSVEFIAIDPAMKKKHVAGLKAELVEQRYVSALTRQSNGLYRYESVRKNIPVSENGIEIPESGLRYSLPADTPGDFAVIIRDSRRVELNRVVYTVVGKANLTRSLEKNAELQVRLNRKDYSAGEEIELSIKAPYVGTGLITIERDRVYAHRWFKTGTTSSVEKIRVPKDLEGNGYVNVTFARAADSREIFMSPLSYAVAPFTVSRERRDMKISVEAPGVARPGEPMLIRYSGKAPGKIVVFAVDEGVLQVADYKTPDPLSHYFQKKALEVKTSQILDQMLPEFELMRELSAAGGDMDKEKKYLGQNLNPFRRRGSKPVAYWSGIKEVDTRERELVYRVPDYFNGTLRVMAVAVSKDAVGSAETGVTVRGDFVLTPNVPTFVAPGDEFEISVGVVNNAEGSGNGAQIKVSLSASEHLELLDGAERVLKINEGKEGSAVFRVRAREVLGEANLSFSASMGDKKSVYSSDLSVRPQTPYMTAFKSGFFSSGSMDVPVERKMYPHFRTLDASASTVPLGLARGLVKYLEKFPYGCTEQLVSKAFPAIVLRNRPEFGYSADKVENNLKEAIYILRARQNSEGAFGYWTASSSASDYVTAYAMHFLTEARDKSYPVPQDLMDKGLKYLGESLRDEGQTLADAREKAYAIYILTRNGLVTTKYLEGLRRHMETNFEKEWMSDLAGVYLAATYKLLRQDSHAEMIINRYKMGKAPVDDEFMFDDGLFTDAQYLYILARHFPDKLMEVSGEDLMSMVKTISDGRYNTISSAYAILAFDAYAETVGSPRPGSVEITELLPEDKQNPLVLTPGLFPRSEFSSKAQKLRFENKSGSRLFYQVTTAGFDTAPPKDVIKEGIEVQREYRDQNGKAVTGARLGAELEVHLKVRSINNKDITNVAVVDLLPGGFEVVLESVRKNHGGANEWRPDNIDAREDRVLIFGTAGPAVKEFVYRIKATNKGNYSVPPCYAEAMYDRSVAARSLGGRLTVEGVGR